MKIKIVFYVGLGALLILGGCIADQTPDQLLRALMKKKANGEFTEIKDFELGKDFEFNLNKRSGTPIITYQFSDEQWVGSYWTSKDYLIVNIMYAIGAEWEYSTGLFKKDKQNTWQPLLTQDLVYGKLDTLIDLNKDGLLEVLIDEYTHFSSGETNFKVLYAGQGKKYEKIDTVARASFIEGLGATRNDPRLSSSIEFLDNGSSVIIQVSEFVLWFEWDQGNPVEKSRSILTEYAWEPPTLKIGSAGEDSKDKPVKFSVESGREGIKFDNKVVISPDDYVEILDYSEGLIAVKNEERGWGFADVNGKLVIACQYSSAGSFEKGRALVNIGDGTTGWRDSYQYIDTNGNLVGKFFEPLTGTSECVTGFSIGSNRSGESLATYRVSNCPDGTMSFEYHGWEWGNGATYFPNTNVKSVIDRLAGAQDEYAAILKKFTGESAAFKEGDFNVKFEVVKNEDGSLQNVNVSIESSFLGTSYTFYKDGDGVLMETSFGS